jgi:RNAse (barnase) inhibitor barstar
MDQCKGDDPKFRKTVSGPLSNNLIKKYAENLKKMIETANKNQQMLLTIINKLFVYTVDPQTGKKQIRVTPSLKEDELQDIVVETRALIIKLYLTCEVDYVNSLNLYEAIVDSKIFETAQSQIDNLNKLSDKLVTEETVPIPAEVQEIKEKVEEKIIEKKEEVEKQLTDIKKDEQIVQTIPEDVLNKPVTPQSVKENKI